MQNISWKFIPETINSITSMDVGGGGNLEVSNVCSLSPKAWLEFLNADTSNAKSIWPVYAEVKKSIETLNSWLMDMKYTMDPGPKDMNLLSREEFQKIYSEEMQQDAIEIQNKMREAIDSVVDIKGVHDRFMDVSRFTFTVMVENNTSFHAKVKDIPCRILRVNVLGDDPKFWLSVMVSDMLFHYSTGGIALRCVAPDCRNYFIPSPRGHQQKYHNVTCRKKHYMRQRRSEINKNVNK